MIIWLLSFGMRDVVCIDSWVGVFGSRRVAVLRSYFFVLTLTTTRGVEFDNLDFKLEMVVVDVGFGCELKVDGVRYGRVERNSIMIE
jgi:hypothetical protein